MKGNCRNCGSEMTFSPAHKKVYCNNQCQADFQHKTYIMEWKEGVRDGTKSRGAAMSYHVRRYLHEKYQSQCVQCGWGEINPTTGKTPLEIDHIDGDSENNREQNLRLLCPNCHSLTSTWKALNKGNASKKRLRYHSLGR